MITPLYPIHKNQSKIILIDQMSQFDKVKIDKPMQSEVNHARYNTRNCFDPIAHRRYSNLATQRRVGIWTKRALGHRLDHYSYFNAARKNLTGLLFALYSLAQEAFPKASQVYELFPKSQVLQIARISLRNL